MVSTNYEENVKMGDFSMQSYKILFVDDDEKLLALLVEYFTQEQFAVSTARNGNEALAQIKGTRPDILVLDVMLPGQSGLDICCQPRRVEFWAAVVVHSGAYAQKGGKAGGTYADRVCHPAVVYGTSAAGFQPSAIDGSFPGLCL